MAEVIGTNLNAKHGFLDISVNGPAAFLQPAQVGEFDGDRPTLLAQRLRAKDFALGAPFSH
jgi:hypothetical protein